MYKAEEESTNHLLFHYPKAAMIWQLNFALFGVQWVMPNSIKETILSWHDSLLGRKEKGVECCLYVYFGPYGRREIEEALKTSNWWIKLFYSLFCTCFWIGLGYM